MCWLITSLSMIIVNCTDRSQMPGVFRHVWRLSTMLRINSICLLFFCIRITSGEKLTHWYKVPWGSDQTNAVYNIDNTTRTWWDAAQIGCGQYGGKLSTLKSGYLPPHISQKLYPFRKYWLGALEYPTWRWTDGSSLYKYEGYTLPISHVIRFQVPGNSPMACHKKCGRWYHWFGLQGNYCRCLDRGFLSYKKLADTEVRCPGNFHQRCGDGSGMSVYSTDIIKDVPNDDAECGYAKVMYSSQVDLYLSSRCHRYDYKCAICNNTGQRTSQWCSREGGICVNETRQLTLDSWNNTCSLAKITQNNKDAVTEILRQKAEERYYGRHNCPNGYWVGLGRYTDGRWIDEKSSNISNAFTGVSSFPRCLAVYKPYYTSARLIWASCTSRYPSICETFRSSGTTRFPPTGAASTSARPHDNMTSVPVRGAGTQTHVHQDENRTGVYFGSFFAVIVLLGVVTMTILSYRQKWLCFKTAAGHQYRKTQFNASSDRATISVIQTSEYEDILQPTTAFNFKAHTAPVATVKPTYQNAPFEEELKKRIGHCNEFASKQTKQSRTDDWTDDSHYEVPVIDKQEHEMKIGNPTYDFPCDNEDDIISGKSSVPRSDTVPVPTGRVQSRDTRGRVISGKDASHSQKPSGGNYDVPGHKMSAVHGHVGTSSRGHHYDTIGNTGPEHLSNKENNRISSERMHRSTSAGYNNDSTLQIRPVQFTPSGCRGPNDFRVKDEEVVVEDDGAIYHYIDDGSIKENRTGYDNPQRFENNMNIRHGGPVSDGCYYNVAFTSESGEPVKARRDNVYRSAMSASDA